MLMLNRFTDTFYWFYGTFKRVSYCGRLGRRCARVTEVALSRDDAIDFIYWTTPDLGLAIAWTDLSIAIGRVSEFGNN
jgi:hypothetical protein